MTRRAGLLPQAALTPENGTLGRFYYFSVKGSKTGLKSQSRAICGESLTVAMFPLIKMLKVLVDWKLKRDEMNKAAVEDGAACGKSRGANEEKRVPWNAFLLVRSPFF